MRYDSLDPVVLGENFLYTFSFAMSCWLLHQAILGKKFQLQLLNHIRVKASIAISAGILLSFLYDTIFSQLFSSSPFLVETVSSQRKFIILIFRGLIISGFQFFIVYYLFIIKQSQQRALENERLKKENLEAKLASLKQQISPHFLFNTFNTLSSMSREDKVKEFIFNISQVYRYLLQISENNLVTLDQELKFVNSYAYILSERFEDALHLEFNIDPVYLSRHLPPMALQMLIENAVKHNIVSVARPLTIHIFVEQDQLIVRNNIQSRISYEEPNGQGLYNISERYKLLSNSDIEILRDHQSFLVKLPLLVAR